MTSKSLGWGWGLLIATAVSTTPCAWAETPDEADAAEDPSQDHGPEAGDEPPSRPVPHPDARPAPAATPAPPASDNVQRALALHDEAKQLYARGQYPGAIAKLEEAAGLDPSAIPLHYNLGLIEEKMGHLDTALKHFRRTLELEKNRRERQHLARTIKRIEGARALHVLGQRSEGSSSSGRPHPSPSGEGPDGAPRISSAPSSFQIAAYATAGGSLVALATASALFVRAVDLDPGEGARTGNGVTIDDLEADAAAANRYAIGADVMFGLGAVGAATALVLAIVDGTRADDEARPSNVSLAVGPGGGVATWRF